MVNAADGWCICFCTSVRFTFLSTLPSISQLNSSTIPSYESLQCLPLNLRPYKPAIIVCIVELQPFLQNSSCLGKVFHNFSLMVWETTSCLVLITFVPMAVLERQMRSSVRVYRELFTLCSFILHCSFITFYQSNTTTQIVLVWSQG